MKVATPVVRCASWGYKGDVRPEWHSWGYKVGLCTSMAPRCGSPGFVVMSGDIRMGCAHRVSMKWGCLFDCNFVIIDFSCVA